jgi:hypothetical protein
MTTSASRYEIRDGVAVVTMDDGKGNPLSHAVIDEIMACLGRAESEAQAVLLIGRERRLSGGSIGRRPAWKYRSAHWPSPHSRSGESSHAKQAAVPRIVSRSSSPSSFSTLVGSMRDSSAARQRRRAHTRHKRPKLHGYDAHRIHGRRQLPLHDWQKAS